MFGLNPWLIVAFLLALATAGGSGFKLGMDHVRAQELAQLQEAQKAADEKQEVINGYAKSYEVLKQNSDEAAANLRRQLNEQRGQLSACSGNFALLNARYVRLHNAALQAASANSDQPANASTGAGFVTADDVIDNAIENGKRWKQCRTQLNALIEVVSK